MATFGEKPANALHEKVIEDVHEVTDTTARQSGIWRVALLAAARQGGDAVMTLTSEQEKAFSTYHDPVSYIVSGSKSRVRPSMKIATSGRAAGGLRSTPELVMCERCFKVARKLLTCSQCKTAYYCNAACQKAGWAEHRAVCDLRRSAVESSVHDRVLDRGAFFGGVLAPDRPQLCRFWLAAIINSCPKAPIQHVLPLLLPLAAFLWRYTSAALPQPLAAPLAKALTGLQKVLDETQDRHNTGAHDMTRKAVAALKWILRSETIAWPQCTLLTRDKESNDKTHDRKMQQTVAWSLHNSMAEVRSFIINPPGRPAVEPGQYGFCIRHHMRANGLLGSAFGVLLAPERLNAEIERYMNAAGRSVPMPELRQMTVASYATLDPPDRKTQGPNVLFHQVAGIASQLADLAARGVPSVSVRAAFPFDEPSKDALDRACDLDATRPHQFLESQIFNTLRGDAERAATARAVYGKALSPTVHGNMKVDLVMPPFSLPAR